ncbi:MAG: tyrosine-type recombinase/integrase [Alphaproteobacteria bacterium]|nr:tyrosine-type recombinase/integrase [Alphaproteobacteria bacterium]
MRKDIGIADHVNHKSVAVARSVVIIRSRKIELGQNPDEDSVDYKQHHELTIGSLLEKYFAEHISSKSLKHQQKFATYMDERVRDELRKGEKSNRGRNKINQAGTFLQNFGVLRVSDLTPLKVKQYHSSFKSASGANAMLECAKAMFNWGIQMQLVICVNPCTAVKPRKVIKEKRDYSSEDIRKIRDAIFQPPAILAEQGKRTEAQLKQQNEGMQELCRYLGILLLTMARPSEVLNAQYSHFDHEGLVWKKHMTKGIKLSNQDEYSFRAIPIPQAVSDLIRQQKELHPKCSYIFPQRNADLPRDNFRKSFDTLKRVSQLPEQLQIYDLKRIAISTLLMEKGLDPKYVSHYVDHKGNLDTTRIYDLGLVDLMRPVSEAASRVLQGEKD